MNQHLSYSNLDEIKDPPMEERQLSGKAPGNQVHTSIKDILHLILYHKKLHYFFFGPNFFVLEKSKIQ